MAEAATDEPVVEDVVEEEVVEVDTEAPDTETEPVDETDTDEVKASDEEKDEPGESSTPKKEGTKFQERISEVTTQFRTEQEARIKAEQRSLELEQQLRAKEQQTPQPGPEKTLADFDYDEGKYKDYLTAHVQAAARADVQRNQQQEQNNRRSAEFTVREEDFAKTVDNYMTETRSAMDLSPHVANALKGMEKGPEVLYYLSKNKSVAAQLSRMNPYDMAGELVRIELQKLAKPEKAQTKTPPPPKKLKPAQSKTGGLLNESETQAQFEKRRRAQIAKR